MSAGVERQGVHKICGGTKPETELQECKKSKKVFFTCFDCSGEPNVKYSEVNPNGFLKSGENWACSIPEKLQVCGECEDINLFGLTWDKGSVLLKRLGALFKMASKELMVVNSAAKLNANALGLNINWSYSSQNSYFLSRKYCVELFIFIRNFVDSVCSHPDYYWILNDFLPELSKKLINFRRQLGKLTELPEYVYLHGCHSSGNKSSQPAYHLLHMHLDLRWLYLNLILKVQYAKRNIENRDSQFYEQPELTNEVSTEIKNLIRELLELSVKRYEKTSCSELCRKSPFSCTCIQEMWIMLQLVADTLYTNNIEKNFWEYYNECVGSLNSDEYNFTPVSRAIFSFWLLSNVAKLYKVEDRALASNYPVLESLVKTIVLEEINESEMRTCLTFIEFICIKTWEPKVEPLITLWDYFYKKLNSNFYLVGASPMTAAVMSKTASGMVQQVKSYVENRSSVLDSFQHFLRLIGLHLQRSKGSPRHWNVIKGRIFSKLSHPKLCSLSQAGEYHLVLLFLMLDTSNGVSQVDGKMIELFNVIKDAKGLVSNELIKGLFAFVILKLESNEHIGKLVQPLVDYVNSLSPLESYDMIKMYVEEMEFILKTYSSLNLGQHLFISEWLSRYLFSSSLSDSGRLLETILTVLNRLKINMCHGNPEHEMIMFVEKLWSELIAYLKGVSNHFNTSQQVSVLAASLASLSVITGKLDRFKELFDLFISNDTNDIRAVRKFLNCLIESTSVVNILHSYNNSIVKAWVRCCIMCPDSNHKEMHELTCYISKIAEIKSIVNPDHLMDCAEPLYLFLSCLQEKYTSNDIYERQSLREKVSIYFEGIDRWLKPVISSPRDYDQVNNVYQSLGNIIRMISPLLYVKSKPNTPLQQLLDLTLLPVSVRNPESKLPHNIVQCVKTSLHLFILGLFKLIPDQDHYIMRTIKELLTIYIPRCVQIHQMFNFTDFSLISQFGDFEERSQCFILETVCGNFLRKKSRNPHNQALYALKFLEELFTAFTNSPEIVKNVLRLTFDRMCDIFMFCDDKSQVHSAAKDILRLFLNSSSIRKGNFLMDDIVRLLTSLANEHLAWSSRQLFELVVFLSSEAPDLTSRFLPHLLEIIKEVEKKRGVGYDKTLRLGFERIESRLRAIKNEET
ncbi:protein MMS22-like [Cimex lectularius]|uniref:Protein MMS22-like n=1 Tax=Cimex lectularius TaxID=79782 RepID=A0A8I6S0V9_CIMLE|nr:protein MMS22-like [Cimex lectularius]